MKDALPLPSNDPHSAAADAALTAVREEICPPIRPRPLADDVWARFDAAFCELRKAVNDLRALRATEEA